MSTSRRGFLMGFGMTASLGLSGCVNDETKPDNRNSDNRSNTTAGPAASGQETTFVSGTGPNVLMDRSVAIEGGDYIATDFSIGSRVKFNYILTVKNDVPVDLFVVENTGFLKYKKDQFIDPDVLVPRTDDDTGEFDLPEGNYYVVIDHTNKLKAEPPGKLEPVPAEVDIKITY